MRRFPRPTRRLTALGLALLAGAACVAGMHWLVTTSDISSAAGASSRVLDDAATTSTSSSTSTSTSTTTSTTTPVVIPPPAPPAFNTGNPQLDALLPTLPAVLFEGDAAVHYGYNPVDCCYSGGYNPEPNDVWVSERAFSSPAKLTYVAVHELAHSVHLHSFRRTALTDAVAGAPVVREGPWDASEKVADCVAWVLYPAETAASGITYWGCPEPWRSQVAAAIR